MTIDMGIEHLKLNPLVYEEFWLAEATNDTKTWSVDNVEDMPFVSLETCQANCDRWHKEFPHIHYKPVRYVRCEEKRVN